MKAVLKGAFFGCVLVGFLALPWFNLHVWGENFGVVSLADPALSGEAWSDGDSVVADVSGDGRFVVVLSAASNLAANQAGTGTVNVYRRDRSTGEVLLVSKSQWGNQGGNDHSSGARITPDGRFVVFQSRSSDLTEGDLNDTEDVFLWDGESGTILMVSVAAGQGDAGNGASTAPMITPDGRFVAFVSAATDLVPGDTNEIPDVFVRDVQSGQTWLASVGARRMNHALSGSESPVLSSDGRYVAFESLAHELVPGVQPTSGQVYLRDMVAGQTRWVSRDATNLAGLSLGRCYNAVLSADGRFVAFKAAPTGAGPASASLYRYDVLADQTLLVATGVLGNDISLEDDSGPVMTPDGQLMVFTRQPGSSANPDVFLWEAASGTLELVSVNRDGTGGGDGKSDTPWISPDGRWVTFLSQATDLVAVPTTGASAWYRRDRGSGITTLLSTDSTWAIANSQDVIGPVHSDEGGVAIFDVFDDFLMPGDSNDAVDLFAWDTGGGSGLTLLSRAAPGLRSVTGAGRSWSAPRGVSDDGRYVVFASEADDLVPGDVNGVSDVFLRDLETGVTILLSVSAAGAGSGNAASAHPSISADGQRVAFASYAGDLVANDGNDDEDVFVRDWQAGNTVLASVGTSGLGTTPRTQTLPALSPDGRYVAFKSRSTAVVIEPLASTDNLYVRDLETATTLLVTKNLPGPALSLPVYSAAAFAAEAAAAVFDATSSGRRMVYRVDLLSNTKERIDVVRPGGVEPWSAQSFGASMSADGQRVVFVSSNSELVAGDANQRQDVFLRDLSSASTFLISLNTNGVSGNGDATEAVISENGRWVAFTSWASDLVAGDANRGLTLGTGDKDVFLHDRETRSTRLISRSCLHDGSADRLSDSPAISADGRWILFRSAASDLVAADENGRSDIFVYDRLTGLNTLMSRSLSYAGGANDGSYQPVLSSSGGVSLFYSWASDLIPADLNATSDVFWAGTQGSGGPTSLVTGIEAMVGNGVRIYWTAEPGQNYAVEYLDEVISASWLDLPGSVRFENGRGMMEDPAPAAVGHRYYRVLLNPISPFASGSSAGGGD